MRLADFPCGSILPGYKLRVEWEGELSLFNNEFVLFCVNNQHNFLSIYQIVVLKEFWRFFDAVRGFYINSAPESNSLFGGN